MIKHLIKVDYIKQLMSNNNMSNDVLLAIDNLKNVIIQEQQKYINELKELDHIEITKRELNVSPGNLILINNAYLYLSKINEDTLELIINDGEVLIVKYIII
jgi:CTP-dependent riboflavin kinase